MYSFPSVLSGPNTQQPKRKYATDAKNTDKLTGVKSIENTQKLN